MGSLENNLAEWRNNVMLTEQEKLDVIIRPKLAEWLIRWGTRWVTYHELSNFVGLGLPERMELIERRTKLHRGDYLQWRLTQKGLDFIQEGNDAQTTT